MEKRDFATILDRLMHEGRMDESVMAPVLKANMPVGWLESALSGVRAVLGAYRFATDDGQGDPRLTFDHGEIPVRFSVDGEGRIASMLFLPPKVFSGALEPAVAILAAAPGQVGVLALEDGRERVGLAPDVPLAVGSAFKLAVLDVLADEIAGGRWRWDDVVELDALDLCLPTGILQDWPPGAPLTLYSLAALMISLSDNTAADALIRLLGRDELERRFPRNRPFLKCREFLVLRVEENADLRDRFVAGDEAERRKVLAATCERPLPTVESAATQAMVPGIEWYFTARELCGLIEATADLPLMSINPGPALVDDWVRVAFKGGSETGVLNLTTRVQAEDGRIFAVAATINAGRAIEENTLILAYETLLSALPGDLKKSVH